jgi:hypothetical protein
MEPQACPLFAAAMAYTIERETQLCSFRIGSRP